MFFYVIFHSVRILFFALQIGIKTVFGIVIQLHSFDKKGFVIIEIIGFVFSQNCSAIGGRWF
jgi:hypothetical protein